MQPPSTFRPDAGPSAEPGWAPAAIPALEPVAEAVPDLLAAFLHDRVEELCAIDPALEAVGAEVGGIALSGGKRLRPAFVYWGHRATGADHDPGVLVSGAAVELLHTFALIHDDIMDRSAERHGRPAAHIALQDAHEREALTGDPAWFGVSGGILAGDLAFVWADALFDGAPLTPSALAAAREVFTTLRIEVMAGQYLDLRLAGLAGASEQDSRRVALLKSGRYTVTRPLQLGVAIGGGGQRLGAALTAYGDATGLAFQLRDDILGLFGDPADTGKGVLDDLREGKRTLLLLRARALADAAAAEELDRIIGDPELGEAQADRARQIVTETGALAHVDAVLDEQLAAAVDALGPVPEPAAKALTELAEYALNRTV